MSKGYKYLTLADRQIIEKLYAEGERPADIAAAIDVNTATLYRELRRGRAEATDSFRRYAYSAEVAQRVVAENFRWRGHRKRAAAAGAAPSKTQQAE